jgi:hypothetical protein
MNPIEIFKQWYIDQDADVRSQIAFFAAACLPDRQDNPPVVEGLYNANEFFDSWLEQRLANKYQVLGRLLCLREIVCFMVFRDRVSLEDWDIHRERTKAIAANMRSSGKSDLAQHLENSLVGMDGRAAVWMAAAESWRKLCDNSLSNERIEAWLVT